MEDSWDNLESRLGSSDDDIAAEARELRADMDAARAGTLRQVNGLRRFAGYGPLKDLVAGEQGQQFSCPIAMSLKCLGYELKVGTERIEWVNNYLKLTTDMQFFIKWFDEGFYPDLVRAD